MCFYLTGNILPALLSGARRDEEVLHPQHMHPHVHTYKLQRKGKVVSDQVS